MQGTSQWLIGPPCLNKVDLTWLENIIATAIIFFQLACLVLLN